MLILIKRGPFIGHTWSVHWPQKKIMAVNIFGNRREGGKDGKDGKDGLDLVHFLPDKIKRWYREAEEIWLYFNTKTDAIVYDKDPTHKTPVGLKNHGRGIDAMFGGTAFPDIDGIINRERIRIINTTTQVEYFKFEYTESATLENSTAVFSISFKEISKCEQYRILFANERQTRGVAVKSGYLLIFCGKERKEITFNTKHFCILFLEYNCLGTSTKCFYDAGTAHGKIECNERSLPSKHVYFGGFPTLLGANHEVATFELHYTPHIARLTEDMRDLLRKDIKTRTV